ncbi:abortive infection protein, putative [Syntrophobotulus glycolicus DSM 8271]|uniref:Abortive infection protein, putative n=1 Tax=Syntrophobotulus glycolicus (strain DSM 8271 / FlGlyR) TaxID=645991 RepID=F0SUJ2_SYNGF|nr:ATP-binding protein [Syntrophobotulus glycolicus]ADY55485.1 abortive infection protein, putative [Syntrophobotulus glycolicus DSM 8271]
MLIKYVFQNFRSFKGKTQLEMRAGAQRTLDENLIRENGLRILPSAVIYGANASGKSNIMMSLALMREIVLQGSLEASSSDLNNLELYPFAHDSEQNPMLFEVEFTNEGSHFLYSFEVMTKQFDKEKRQIISEQLWINSNKGMIRIFERDRQRVEIKRDKKVLSLIQYDEKLLGEFENKINKNLDPSELFLTHAFKTVVSSEIADKVIDFFKNKLIVVSDFTLKKTNLTFSAAEMPDKDFLAWNKTLDGFVKNADFGPQRILFKSQKSEDEHSADMQLVSIYKSSKRDMMVSAELMESRGTLKLLDFAIPFETFFAKGGVFVLDEFDAAIHPELIKGIIALFNDQAVNKKGAQLIFTTHNPIYLSNKIFRRDQIKFVERDKDTFESTIYSLADFGSTDVRNDQNYLLNYFKGKYGTLPYIDFSKLFTGEAEEEG